MTLPKFDFIGSDWVPSDNLAVDDTTTDPINMLHIMSFHKNTLDSSKLRDGESYAQPYEIVFCMVTNKEITWSFGFTEIDGNDNEDGFSRCLGEQLRDDTYLRLLKLMRDPLSTISL